MNPPPAAAHSPSRSPRGAPPPGGYGLYLLYAEAMLREAGHDTDAWLTRAGIDDPAAIGRGQRVPAGLLMRALAPIAADPALGGFFLRLGQRVPVAAHGAIGMAMLASRDLRQVFELVAAYAPLLVPSVAIALALDDQQACIRITASSGHADFDRCVIEALASTFASHLPALAGRAQPPLAAHFAYPEPAYGDRYRMLFGPRCRFATADTRLVYPRSLFERPLPGADPVNLRLLLAQCEQEMALAVASQSWAERVRSLLFAELARDPTAAWVARRLGCPERTLRRRLAADGYQFRTLLAEVRLARARQLLGDGEQRIGTIATQLGYRDAGGFRRAFRQATGQSPRAWRSALRLHRIPRTVPDTTA